MSLFVASSVTLLLLTFILYHVFNRVDSKPSSFGRMTEADMAMNDLLFIQTREGKVEWKIRAETAELFEKQKELRISNISVELKNRDDFKIRFQAKSGKINTETYDFQIENGQENIEVNLEYDYKILTKEIEWDNEQHKIQSKAGVKIVTPEFIARGKHFSIDTTREELTLLQDVYVTLQ